MIAPHVVLIFDIFRIENLWFWHHQPLKFKIQDFEYFAPCAQAKLNLILCITLHFMYWDVDKLEHFIEVKILYKDILFLCTGSISKAKDFFLKTFCAPHKSPAIYLQGKNPSCSTRNELALPKPFAYSKSQWNSLSWQGTKVYSCLNICICNTPASEV